MPRTWYERLSAESARLLARERSRSFAHSSVLLVFESGPLADASGGVDFDAIRSALEARLAAVPRARQKLRWVPVEAHPIRVDDPDFSLEYHLRHTSLPRPGGEAQLQRMVARIHAQRLDRSRPLWECWVLEGLEGGRFATLWKTHHCMVDRDTPDDLLAALLAAAPDEDAEPTAASYRPRPAPSAYELVRDEVVRQARLPRRVLGQALRTLRDETWRHELDGRARRVAKLLGYTVRPRSAHPLAGPIGPHRRFASGVVPLAELQAVHRALGASLHDVLLAALAGAVRSFFLERLVNPATVDFRASVPVRLAGGGPEAVGEWIVELPIWEKDARERVARIRAETDRLRAETPALAARAQTEALPWSPAHRLGLGARAVSQRLPVDLAVLSVPGPQAPRFFRGARLVEAFGIAPLRPDHALAVTVLSYDAKLCWALNADFDRLVDLDRLAAALGSAFEELRGAARSAPALSVVRRRSRRHS